MQVPTIERRRRPFRIRGWIILVVAILIVLVLSLRGVAGFYTDYLWFDSVGFGNTWGGLLVAKIAPALVFTVAFFVVMLASLTIADRLAPRARTMGPEDELIDRYQQAVGRYAGRIRIGVSAFFAIIAGASVSGQWQQWILFRNPVSFGVKDPQFHKDIGFYVFRLPFLKFSVDWAFAALVIVLIVTAVAHYLNGGIRLQTPYQRVTPQVKAHLSVLLALMALVKAVGYYLAQFELNFSHRGVVEGASYTDVTAQLQALRLLLVVAVIAAALFIWNIWRRGWVLPIIAVGLWALLSLVVGTIYPAFIQNFKVNPNELSREKKYIARNIAGTRAAFGLDNKKVTVKQFNYDTNLTTQSIVSNTQTIDNARIWDQQELLTNYISFQQLGTFYKFGDADIDRYNIGGTTTQVLLSARELNQANLPSQSWVSRHLVYTHGYGLAVSPTNAFNPNSGGPNYLLSNIPPNTADPRLKLTQPRIYFGEGLTGYSVVDAKSNEFDYPRKGQADATNRYNGGGGVGLSSIVRRAAFALRFNDFNLLISGQIQPKSQILYLRDIRARVHKAAPFLKYDADPYPVILNGKVLWVQDAYTTTDRYPYSQAVTGSGGLSSRFNYVRNSVKVTIDAYTGKTTFYVIDKQDPILRSYRKAFPELFTDIKKAPAGLLAHLRYPEDLFSVQTDQYGLYHMTNPTTFFNKTDLWLVSPDPGSGPLGTVNGQVTATTVNPNRPTAATSSGNRIAPIYLLIRLPGQSQEDFLILRPYVPVSRGNQLTGLVSFMVAKADPNDYGKLESYVLPTGQTVAGPEQINNQIATTTDISQQFTLLGQQGSQVIQGSLQLIPVDNSIIYIRPIYVQASQGSQLPSFRFVIASYGNVAKIGTDLNNALKQFPQFSGLPTSGQAPPATPTTPSPTPTPTTPNSAPPNATVAQLLQQASTLYNQAQAALANKDLATYQADINQVGALLQQALAASGATPSASTTTTTAPAPKSSRQAAGARG